MYVMVYKNVFPPRIRGGTIFHTKSNTYIFWIIIHTRFSWKRGVAHDQLRLLSGPVKRVLTYTTKTRNIYWLEQ